MCVCVCVFVVVFFPEQNTGQYFAEPKMRVFALCFLLLAGIALSDGKKSYRGYVLKVYKYAHSKGPLFTSSKDDSKIENAI